MEIKERLDYLNFKIISGMGPWGRKIWVNLSFRHYKIDTSTTSALFRVSPRATRSYNVQVSHLLLLFFLSWQIQQFTHHRLIIVILTIKVYFDRKQMPHQLTLEAMSAHYITLQCAQMKENKCNWKQNSAVVERHTAVTVYFSSKQLLLFALAWQSR